MTSREERGQPRHMAALLSFALSSIVVAVGCPLRSEDHVGPDKRADLYSNGRIAFVRSAGRYTDVYTITPAATGLRRITQWPGFKNSPSWSPDGRSLALAARRAGSYSIYVTAANGRRARRLMSGPGINGSPDWSPDARRIAFSSNRGTSSGFDIYVMKANGTDITELTKGQDPSWAPDGTRISYSKLQGSTFDIFTVGFARGALGDASSNLTRHDADDRDPDWSPDGSKIAFVSDRAGDFDVYVMSTDGTDLTRLTHGPQDDFAPAWSPDQTMIAFGRTTPGAYHIFLMDADGAHVEQLTRGPLFDVTPAWQPLER
jgi:Tol biopolymer transport system component